MARIRKPSAVKRKKATCQACKKSVPKIVKKK